MRSLAMVAALLLFVSIVIMGCVESTTDAGQARVNGSGRVVRIERSFPPIHGVHLATFGDLKITLGEKQKFLIEAEDNLIDYIETEVHEGILEIDTRRHISLRTSKRVRYYLTVRELDTIAISSSGDIEAPYVECETFDVRSSSSGDLDMQGINAVSVNIRMSSSGDVDLEEVEARELEVDISSSGDLSIDRGAVRFQMVRLSSSGDYIAKRLKSDNAQVSISSSGDAYIQVDGELNASLSSSGSLYYSGDASLQYSISSSGRLRHIGR
jgi:hypothetical protein